MARAPERLGHRAGGVLSFHRDVKCEKTVRKRLCQEKSDNHELDGERGQIKSAQRRVRKENAGFVFTKNESIPGGKLTTLTWENWHKKSRGSLEKVLVASILQHKGPERKSGNESSGERNAWGSSHQPGKGQSFSLR